MLRTLVSGDCLQKKQFKKKNPSNLMGLLKYQKHLQFLVKTSLGNSSCAILHAQ